MSLQKVTVTCLILSIAAPSCVARRVIHFGRHGAEDSRIDAGGPCGKVALSCSHCLMFSGPCSWCPAALWNGNASALGKRAGVCQKASEVEDVHCGGDGWSVTTDPDGNAISAQDKTVADSFCTEASSTDSKSDQVELDEWKGARLSTMTGASIKEMHDENVGKLATLLDRIAMDLRRFRIFQDVNPLLFEQNFDPDSGDLVKYAWKGSILAFGFLDLGFGGVLSSVIAMAAGGITDVTEEFVKDMRISQKQLIEKGGRANVQYFSDISYRVLMDCYLRVRKLPKDKLELLQKSLVQNDGGTFAGNLHQLHSSTGGKVAKFGVQAGLFAGGFFTAGVTWMIGAGIGVVNYATSVAAEEVSKTAAETKLELILGIARSRSESAWGEAGETCSITKRNGKDSICTAVAPPPGSCTVCDIIPRFCSRGSMWDSHVAAVPQGEVSPEGRCMPTRLPQLADGFPCHAHSNCKSSYCHYEPRLQYFISDHVRRYCESGASGCYDPILQLSSLSKVVPRPASEIEYQALHKTLRGFVGKYDSYEGVEFATTGTCATACPESEIGIGSCSHAGHTGRFGVRKSRTETHSNDDRFTIKEDDDTPFPTRFEKIGNGRCVNHDGALVVVEEIRMETDSVKECASHCVAKGLSAFEILRVDEVSTCRVLANRPGSANKTIKGTAVCYDTELPWPLDSYQPWNRIWRNYRSEVRQILGRLPESSRALSKIREAYRSFCIKPETVDQRGHPVLDPGCDDPRQWDADRAASMLMHMAPLSAKQLHTLYSEIFDQGGLNKKE